MADDLVTPAEAARILGTNKMRVARMIARGELARVTKREPVDYVRRADVERLAPLGPARPGRPRKAENARDSKDGAKTP